MNNNYDTVETVDYAILYNGKVLVAQALGCENCRSTFSSYIQMTMVNENDQVLDLPCPNCSEESLVIITYQLGKENDR